MKKLSILVSSFNRLPLLRRALWGIATRPPTKVPFEVILVDDGSTEDVLGELKRYSSKFEWKFVRFNAAEFEAKTGLKKFHNSPAVTNNIAYRHASGDLIVQQGNEVIPWADVYDQLIADAPDKLTLVPTEKKAVPYWMVVSTTFDLPKQYLDLLDQYGQNLLPAYVRACEQWPLQSHEYRSDVTNYISLAPRALWEKLQGYDERYYGGISAEDSDFVRRARALPDFKMVVSQGISLHQFHSGKTCYYDPPPAVISKERWAEGVAMNHAIYHDWDQTHQNRQRWPWGEYGVGEVITNG